MNAQSSMRWTVNRRPEMPHVEFIYEQNCPFVRNARRRLVQGFYASGLPPQWMEWEIADPTAPEYLRDLGSPTILVNGRDITGIERRQAENCCRIYNLSPAEQGVPSAEMIASALVRAASHTEIGAPLKTFRARSLGAMFPMIGLAMLPKLTCPACWPAYAGLLSSLGVGFVNYTPYLLPVTASFLVISVSALAYRARRRQGYGPFLIGILATLTVLIGKFRYDNDGAMWMGLGILVLASVWNAWPPTFRREQRRKHRL